MCMRYMSILRFFQRRIAEVQSIVNRFSDQGLDSMAGPDLYRLFLLIFHDNGNQHPSI